MRSDTVLVEEIFSEALTRSSAAQRAAYLNEACDGQPVVRRRVEALLASHEAPDNFLKLPGIDPHTNPTAVVREGPGSRIGGYKLLEQIGEGGFASVFVAEQEFPVRRRVALKIIKLGMDTRQVVARFEAERQALAMMNHPGIAKVFDAGSTESGRPYFVMELVRGIPITDYCDKGHLSIRQRLELFLHVCEAVQHAHQKGVIHRDIKPSNVLASTQDGRPLVKMIDFGIAKAMQTRLTDKTVYTEFHQMIGTPQYMSPEQAEGSLDMDTRSDVYSLGVLLYELLAGSPPFDPRELRSQAFVEMQRIIREVEPPVPSTRLSLSGTSASIAADRRSEPAQLSRLMRGELDWIVMKCLEKDRTRRYESASALASDLRRYLADEPVSARRPSAAYQARKFIQRHKAGVMMSAGIFLLLVLGIIGTTSGMLEARRAQREALEQKRLAESLLADVRSARESAEREASRAKAISEFLQYMLMSARPIHAGAERDVRVVDVLDQGAQELVRLSGQPDAEFDARVILGLTYEDLGRREQAREQLSRARTLAVQQYGEDSRVTLGITGDLVRIMARTGEAEAADAMCRESMDIARRTFGEDHRVTCVLLNNQGLVLIERQAYAEAEAVFRSLVARAHDTSLGLRSLLPVWLNNLAVALRSQGKADEAAEVLAEVNAILTARREADPILRGHAKRNLALSLKKAGKLEEAEAAYEDALADQRVHMGIEHPNTRITILEYATLLERLGRNDEAAALRQELSPSSLKASPDDLSPSAASRPAVIPPPEP